MSESALIAFYRGTGTDHAGRRFDDILSWDAARLEITHDYIQWLFPLPEASRFNPDAPLLTAADIAAFRHDERLGAQVVRAFDAMMTFFGFRRDGALVQKARHFDAASRRWLQPVNHNHLRLTRILLFLRHAGRANLSASLLASLLHVAEHDGRSILTARTVSFWRETQSGAP